MTHTLQSYYEGIILCLHCIYHMLCIIFIPSLITLIVIVVVSIIMTHIYGAPPIRLIRAFLCDTRTQQRTSTTPKVNMYKVYKGGLNTNPDTQSVRFKLTIHDDIKEDL